MANSIRVGNTTIELGSIKEFRIVEREYVYRPIYKEIYEEGFFSNITRYEYVGMEPYAARFYESEKNYFIGSENVKNPKDIQKKSLFKKNVVDESKIGCINKLGRVFYTRLYEIPVLIIKHNDNKVESSKFRMEHPSYQTPLIGKLEIVPALYIKANHEYIFYGKGIHLDDVEKSYEDIQNQLALFNPLLYSMKTIFDGTKKIVEEKVVPAGKEAIKKSVEIKDDTIEEKVIPFAKKILKKEQVETEYFMPETYKKVGSAFNKETYYVYDNDSTKGRISVKEISKKESFSFYDIESVINDLHEKMNDNEGLIEVKNGLTTNNNKYIYYIKKSFVYENNGDRQTSLGNKYFLCMNIKKGTSIYLIRAEYEEIGITGVRESVGYELYRRANTEESFTKDPYNPEYTKGHLMNYAEKEEFDAVFDTHPLTMLRQFIREVLVNN